MIDPIELVFKSERLYFNRAVYLHIQLLREFDAN